MFTMQVMDTQHQFAFSVKCNIVKYLNMCHATWQKDKLSKISAGQWRFDKTYIIGKNAEEKFSI